MTACFALASSKGIRKATTESLKPRTKPVLDIKWIRDNQDAFLKGLTDRGFDDPQRHLELEF